MMNWIDRLLNPRRRAVVDRDVRSVMTKSDPGLRDYLSRVTQEFFSHDGGDESRIELSQVKLDGDPRYVSDMLKRTEPHDEDYLVFRAFSEPDSIVLDIGANWGYSVGSLRAVGVTGTIVSFEAIPIYKDCLQRIRDLSRGNYQFLMSALSSQKGELTFTVPVVSHVALTALTSASPNPHIGSLVNNIHHHIVNWMPDIENVDLRFCKFKVPVDTLDSVVNEQGDIFSRHAVDAIKIDVEGLEFEVLKGGEGVLRSSHPLVMAEGGNRRDGLPEFMSALGYEYFERAGDKISPVLGMGLASNGFFVHQSKRALYGERGILKV